MTLNQIVKVSYNDKNSYLQVLFNNKTLDFQAFRHTGFYVNYQSWLPGYNTILNSFKKLTRKELAQKVYAELCAAELSARNFAQKYVKYIE